MSDHTKFINQYFYIWAIFLPITSFLLIPSIQGTTISSLMALFSVFLVYMKAVLDRDHHLKSFHVFLGDLFIITIFFLIITGFAQFSLYVGSANGYFIDFTKVKMVEYHGNYVLRATLITQSIYLLAGILTFLYAKHFFNKSWNNYILAGAIFLAGYGLYEWLFYLIFKTNGDFITNRIFYSQSSYGTILQISGSLAQTVEVAGINLLRLKSLTGEPSMYAFTMLPLWILAIHFKRTKTHLFLLATLILSTSTTAFLGIFIYLFFRLLYLKTRDIYTLIFLGVSIILITANIEFFNTIYDLILGNKLDSQSGVARQRLFLNGLAFYNELPIIHQLFGVGFGYSRATNLFTTFLVNIGLIGLTMYLLLFLYPVFKLKSTYENIGYKCSIIVLLFVAMTSVPEFSYLPAWLILGISYSKLRTEYIKEQKYLQEEAYANLILKKVNKGVVLR